MKTQNINENITLVREETDNRNFPGWLIFKENIYNTQSIVRIHKEEKCIVIYYRDASYREYTSDIENTWNALCKAFTEGV